MPDITFLEFLKICKRHDIDVVDAHYELDGRNRMTVKLRIKGNFPRIGECLTAFMTDLRPYLEDEDKDFIHKYLNIEGGSIDLEKKDGHLFLEFFAKGIGLAIE